MHEIVLNRSSLPRHDGKRGPSIHGTTFYHFAHPAEAYGPAFRAMRDMGLDTVRVAEIWPGWEVIETKPGNYDFTDLDRFVDEAAAAGLKVVMGFGINNPPPWIFHDLSDVRCVDAEGRLAHRRVQCANHDHPGYRGLMERFVTAQAQHYARHSAICAWQFGNEIRYGVDWPDNRCTRARFRLWLRERWRDDLDALNGAWSTVFRSWEEVPLYRSAEGAPVEGLVPLLLATRSFYQWSLEELVVWGCALVRRHSNLPVFHNNHGLSGSDYSHWRMSACNDWVVQDIYPTMGADADARDATTLALDLGQSVAAAHGKPYVIGETGIAQYGTWLRNRPCRELSEALTAEMLCAGARGMLYFRHQSPRHEQPHKFTGSQAALRNDGTEVEYARTIRRLSALLDQAGARLADARAVIPEVAAYWPEETMQLAREAGVESLVRSSLFGASAIFNRLGVPLRWLDTERLLGADLAAFRLVWLPLAWLLPRRVGECLAAYARAGGHLASECRPGYVNDEGWLYEAQPGAGLHEVFGGREELFWTTEPQTVLGTVAESQVHVAFPGAAQTYRPDAGTAVPLRNERGEPAALEKKWGRGTSLLLGCAPSLAFAAGAGKYHKAAAGLGVDEPTRAAAVDLVAALCRRAGVARPVAWESAARTWNVRYLDSDAGRLLFLANHGPDADAVLPPGCRTLACRFDGELEFGPREGRLTVPRHGWLLAEARAKGKGTGI